MRPTLVDDPRRVPEAERNKHFTDWMMTLDRLGTAARSRDRRSRSIVRRHRPNSSRTRSTSCRTKSITVEIFGPITETIGGKPALEFLRKPKDDVSIILGTQPVPEGQVSASHTINGHSINFRLRQRNVRFLFTGDMNQESMQRMRDALPDLSLRSEILKTPHHGSADFDYAFLKEVSPVVSLVSSGDESARHEHIHPRATLMAALGRASRTNASDPLLDGARRLLRLQTAQALIKQVSTGQKAIYEGVRAAELTGSFTCAPTVSECSPSPIRASEGMNEAYRFTRRRRRARSHSRQRRFPAPRRPKPSCPT